MPKDECEKLLGKNSSMFDSGASCHMIGGLTLLHETHGVQPISVGLPNGTYILANEQGSASLGKKIKLDNVLFVPSLKCNPLSIARLCKELKCMVTFFADFYVLQDRNVRISIGMIEQQGGVYYFREG